MAKFNIVKNFKVFLYPQSHTVDLQKLAEKFIRRLQYQTGYKLNWMGTNHYNSAHPHTLILINNVDKNGKEVELTWDVIKLINLTEAGNVIVKLAGDELPDDIKILKIVVKNAVSLLTDAKERRAATILIDHFDDLLPKDWETL